MQGIIGYMTNDRQFREWETRVFGAGYGSGELPILKAVKVFFANLEDNRNYDHENLEKNLGDTATWLLINAFDRGGVIEWGTSARYGWLTSCGEYVRDFIKGKTPEELYEIVMKDDNSICLCDGEIKESGHEECGRNPMVNEKYADHLNMPLNMKSHISAEHAREVVEYIKSKSEKVTENLWYVSRACLDSVEDFFTERT